MNDLPPVTIKSDESAAIERSTQAFLKAGGAINHISNKSTTDIIAAMKFKSTDLWNREP